MKTGIEIIADERLRQVEQEGWTFEHDDSHTHEELSMAAAAYAAPESHRPKTFPFECPDIWPWHSSWWKPTPNDRIHELAKAGALIAAEIDRLQRLTT